MSTPRTSDPTGLHRVLDEVPGGGARLPQAAERLDTRRELWPDEVRVRVERLNLDAASYRQLERTHSVDGRVAGDAIRSAVLEIVARRGKMQNPETGSGGMLVGTVEEVGPESRLGLTVGDRVATLVSLTLTPLVIEDGLAGWDGLGEQVPCDGYAVLFGRSIAAVLPEDLPAELSLSVMDVCGAPALTARVVDSYDRPVVAVVGGAGKSGSLSLAAARRAGARHTIGVVPHEAEAALLRDAGLADEVVVADARDAIGLRDAVAKAGGPADVTIVCVDVPGCEGGAILTTADGGTVVFFSMATSFSAAGGRGGGGGAPGASGGGGGAGPPPRATAPGATGWLCPRPTAFPPAAGGSEGLAADVTMLVGNGYAPGHAAYALELLRETPGVRSLFERRLA